MKIFHLGPDEAIRLPNTASHPNSKVLVVSVPHEPEIVQENSHEAQIMVERIAITDEGVAPTILWRDRPIDEVILEADCSVRLSNCVRANPTFFSGWTVGRALANESDFFPALMKVQSLGRKTATEALDLLKAFALDLRLTEDEPPIIDPLSGFDPAKLDASIKDALGGRHVSVRLANLLASGALNDITVRDFYLNPDQVRSRMLGCRNAGKKTVTEAVEHLTILVGALGEPETDSASVQFEHEAPEGLSARQWIVQEIGELPPKAVEVLHNRYGLTGEARQTLQEIAERVHVTRERVRQVESKALKRLRTGIRSRAAFNRYLAEEKEAQLIMLFGTQSCLPEVKVSKRFRKLDPWFLLAIDIVFEDGINGYLSANAYRSDDGWFRTSEQAEDRERQDRLLVEILSTYQTPMPLDTLKEIAPSVTGSMSGENDHCAVRDGYVFTGYVGSKARRTGRMHALARRIAQSAIFDIGTLIAEYRSEFPEDDCGSRMFEMQASEAPHLFAPLFDGIWLCLEHNSREAALLTAPPFEHRRIEETNFTEGSLGNLLIKQLEQFGPQRMIDLRRKLVDSSDGGFSISSVGAVLISNPCFRRVAPGIFGLYSGSSEVPAAIDVFLLEERHCRFYCHARHSGAPQDYYPMWGAAYEMRLSSWAQRSAPTDLYRSLMTVIEPEFWPAPPETIAEFEARRRQDGQWQLGAERRLPLGSRFLDSGQFFSVLTHLVVFGWISWVGVNRATGSKSDNHDAADVLAFLVMTGLVEWEPDWQAPHRPTSLAKRLFLEAQSERHLYGAERLGDRDVFGRLRGGLYDAPPTASRGWVDAEEFREAMPAWRTDGISTGRAFGGAQAREPSINAEGSFESDDWNSVFGN
ncbi:sigma factor-like helix-turn-helix DNA-binding protein [Labrys sedimenti]|uniref:sigma factor-like helix-turn-helix DNA-binding protein n=1 Tax=Labrys sedimenti TaxID=3106036 RepID=UPI002ACAE5F6|nr:sigma factor-like helix-turn-helix DNA-binding protein [Labrys sp. ZIDIC5]MDZ5454435.1 sigma factor-like helix-turn-helix DNA-binding protein [Labrys sp. ZIDIC5]